MIRDVRQAVGRLARALDQDAVLLETDRRAAEPHRPLAPQDEAARLEGVERALDRPRAVERVLVEVAVEGDPEPLLRGADGGEDRLLGGVAEGGAVVCGERRAVALDQAARDVADVLALVAVIGEGRGAADELQVAGAHRLRQHLHLPACVVEVVLALDLPADRRQQAGERVADHRVPPVPDGERAGLVGAHELDLRPAPGARRRAAVCLARGQRVGEHPLPEGRREPEVDEAGTGDLGRPLEPAGRRRGLEVADQQARDGMRRAALAACQDERGVGREVAELGIARYLDGEGRRLRPAELAGGEGGAQRLADELLNVALHSRPRGAKGRRRDAGPGRGERAWRCLYAPPGAGSNSPGGPSSARALRALRTNPRAAPAARPGPTPARLPPRAARALSRSASPCNSAGGPVNLRRPGAAAAGPAACPWPGPAGGPASSRGPSRSSRPRARPARPPRAPPRPRGARPA